MPVIQLEEYLVSSTHSSVQAKGCTILNQNDGFCNRTAVQRQLLSTLQTGSRKLWNGLIFDYQNSQNQRAALKRGQKMTFIEPWGRFS
jgi:hypothetical protein